MFPLLAKVPMKFAHTYKMTIVIYVYQLFLIPTLLKITFMSVVSVTRQMLSTLLLAT